ncbi:MraY family glycosyltransferase [Sulfurovum sp. XTW-4]|uniref:MraY family glycosyltransferase n=1 Tax=Sulfurovum xiamenensis TaxID=3019066 RepID=A0ABT7QRI8_9BACT|nr:MraY family glycosyltransferase [Sulfurovum xiamenensis]MDM5263712.1 MraY family glycosyltransferase [Sulfurovum xiamenensis]
MNQLESSILGAFILSFTLQFLVIHFSHRHDFFIDSHTEEKPQNFHHFSTPRAGGIGIIVGMCFLLLTPLGWKLLFSIILAFLSGIFEDFHNSLSPRRRLLLQLIAATSAVLLTGSVVTYLGLDIHIPYWSGVLFSIFSIVGLMNAVNIIDGFNGLASGIVLLILLSFSTTAVQVESHEILQISMIVTSAVLAFFVVNFPKGKIFLGDGGAYLLGFITALIGIFLASNYATVSPWYILAVLIYPVWEVLFSIYRKRKAKRSPMEPDEYHLHMLIYKHITHNNPLTSVFIVLGTAPFIFCATLYAHNSKANLLIVLVFIGCYTLLYRYLYKKEFALKKQS